MSTCRAQSAPQTTEPHRDRVVGRLNNTRGRQAEWLNLFAVLVLTLAVAVWLADYVQRNATYSFDSDEGVHAFNALRVSAYLRDGDLAGALNDTLRQSFYPPVHPWLLGMVLLLVNATHANARLVSLALYALDVLLLYALGRWLARHTRFPWLAGLMASLLALTSPPLWVLGSLVYLETAGVMFVLVTFWGYWQGVAWRKWGWLVAGLAIMIATLTKYPYGLFLIPPLAVAMVVQALPTLRRHRLASQDSGTLIVRLTLLALPSVVMMLVWIVLPVTRNGLANYIAATEDLAQTAQPSFFAHMAFYLKSVWLQFSPSPLIAVGLAAAFLVSLVRWRNSELWPLALFFAWHLVGISVHGGLAQRFLITAMPALWLMGGVWAARVADAWPRWTAQRQSGKRVARIAMWTAIIALALTSGLGLAWRVTLYPMLYRLSLETDTRAEELYRWTAEQISSGGVRIGLVNDWDQMSGPALGWELTTRRAPNAVPRRADLVTVWEMHRLPEPTPDNVAALRDQMNAHGLNTIVAYTAPGVGIKRLQGTLTILGDKTRLLGQRDFPLRWYWPDRLDDRLYEGESLDQEQLQAAIDQLGTDRSLTVQVYAYEP
jgi:4-amino-4-deoxy-L-arabinose transferase-like glycosyltransferase